MPCGIVMSSTSIPRPTITIAPRTRKLPIQPPKRCTIFACRPPHIFVHEQSSGFPLRCGNYICNTALAEPAGIIARQNYRGSWACQEQYGQHCRGATMDLTMEEAAVVRRKVEML